MRQDRFSEKIEETVKIPQQLSFKVCSAFLPALSVSNDDDDHLDEKSKSTSQLFNIATEHLICEEKEEGGFSQT